ncbi:hypothetical protein Poli38472_010380 [Pythium oligandrum]|uniref:Uncharacterized protein n=1 Tax=Pythium oligandrum TaxID=41045 RepID=A0A8K1FE44_PYTOL|nr:hypothetical protein Poli38472_010380 [Pythium oligandrum]|eukprot:TMW55498.1 hypothetical protein Poli38472_010380 [Pythium oligandrum]
MPASERGTVRGPARRSTESSRALSTSKDKSLSAVTLTKKTNSLVFDVEELKSNLKELQIQGREVAQQDQTLQDVVAKVAALQEAFSSLSDVCIYVEETQKQLDGRLSGLDQRVSGLEKSMNALQSQTNRHEGKRRQFQDASERRFVDSQEAFSKLALSMYETQAELGRVKNTAEHLITREREATNLTQSLESTQEQANEWIQKLRRESSELQAEMMAWKEQSGGACVSLAGDIQSLAKDCSSLRSTVTQQNAQWASKLETLRDAMDRQGKVDKTQLTQRLASITENMTAYELRTKESLGTLLKNHARIRTVVDESMVMCSGEIKALGNEWKTIQEDHRNKLEDLMEQVLSQSIEWSQKHENLRCSVRSLAIQLNVTL